MTITGRARLAGLIGWPVAHSRSPLLHNHWLAELRLDGAYVPLPVAPGHVREAVRALPLLGFAGANVTIPHKEEVAAAMDRLDPLAARIGAVNTIICERDGTLTGLNTDAPGFIDSLREACPGWTPSAGPAVVLGAGGAARAVVAGLQAAGVPAVRLVNRDPARARTVAQALDPLEEQVSVRTWNDVPALLPGTALLVNATSLGMQGHPPLPVDVTALPAGAVVADLVYVPLETPLLAAARARGLAAVDGLGMLIAQARRGFAAWFGMEPPAGPAARHLLEADLAGAH